MRILLDVRKYKVTIAVLIITMLVIALAACGGGSASNEKEGSPETSADSPKVALIVNQKFGDGASTDDMKAGLERAAKEFGFEYKTFESLDVASHEDDIRAVAKDGYNLIFTTYPNMTEGTISIAEEFPDTKFAAIYQFINNDEVSIPNVYDVAFNAEHALYIAGVMAAELSPTGKIGMIAGSDEPATNADSNAFMLGVAKTNSTATVDFAFANSWEDVAKGKEIATGMIGSGVDYIQTEIGTVQEGIMEAAKEASDKNVLINGDTADFSAGYPEGAVSYVDIHFGEAVYLCSKGYIEDTIEFGKSGIMDMKNGVVGFSDKVFDQFVEKNPDMKDKIDGVRAKIEELTKQVVDGSLEVPFDTETPEWKRIKSAA